MPLPSLIVYLQCNPEVELARIHARGRKAEKHIEAGFLKSLNEALIKQIKKAESYVRILTIDSVCNNFVDDEGVKSKLLQIVADAMLLDSELTRKIHEEIKQ